jgi:hypothetical protein
LNHGSTFPFEKEIIPRLSSTTSTQNASPSPARVYLALPPCMQAKRYWRQLMAQAAMIDAVSQCPRLFQIEGLWRPGTMTSSSSSISLRARDFYAGPYSQLKKKSGSMLQLLFFANQPLGTKQAGLAVALSK